MCVYARTDVCIAYSVVTKIFFQAWAVLSSNTKRDFVFSQCVTMFKPTSLLGNENARLGCVQSDSRGQLELQQKNMPPFLHTTLRQKWEEGVCSIIHLVLCIILCPHPTWFLVMLHTTLVNNHDNCHDLCCQFIHSLA